MGKGGRNVTVGAGTIAGPGTDEVIGQYPSNRSHRCPVISHAKNMRNKEEEEDEEEEI